MKILILTLLGSLFFFNSSKTLAEVRHRDIRAPQVDFILIEKSKKKMTLFSEDQPISTYTVSLGRVPGKKQFQGDKKTPEGKYYIDYKIENSDYHLALRISYPNKEDLAYAKKQGRSAGGDIVIHGITNGLGWLGRSHRLINWTQGCIAVTNEEIEEIFAWVEVGTPVEILP